MKYTDLSINLGFHKNMQETNWLKLFPTWWAENDPLIEAIGKEIAYIKAQAIFNLLNITLKPPVMIWQNSLVHKEYIDGTTINSLPELIKLPAPFYKTFGSITLENNTINDISNLKIKFNEDDYIVILDIIGQNDVININVGSQKVYINDKEANILIYGDGLSYFKTGQNKEQYELSDPLHNESVNLYLEANDVDDVNIDVNIQYDNAVFINEQNIEVFGFELIPLESINLYAYYDFPYNQDSNGWRKVYEKNYDPNTNVIYDMITTHFYTKQFYVEVFYKGLDYPYVVGFPCYKDAPRDSPYHVNTNIDKWGVYFGMPRREYKEYIPDEDYPFTFPEYYPFDIEQDYWYYQRLINEYAWNDLAIDTVDLLDTNDKPIVRLHSINPFIEDFVVYAESEAPKRKENIDYQYFIPNWVDQRIVEAQYKRTAYFDTHNLLKYDNNKAYITLRNQSGTFITTQKYLSKPLELFFDLSQLPNDINIDDIKILVEAESTDNDVDKYSNDETGIVIHGISEDDLFLMLQSSNYELEEKEIEYTLSLGLDDIKRLYTKTNINVVQEGIIKGFATKQENHYIIPFTLKENEEIIDDITEVYINYHGLEKYIKRKSYSAEYIVEDDQRYIKAYIPRIVPHNEVPDFDVREEFDDITMDIICKTKDHHSFIARDIYIKPQKTIDFDGSDNPIKDIEFIGPYKEEQKLETLHVKDDWYTGDLRNILQKDGISFINTFQNDSETNTPTILIKNVRLEIDYSPKKTDFTLETKVHTTNISAPNVAQLDIIITNTGAKQLKTNIDIVNSTNLKLSEHYFDIDLEVGDHDTKYVNITPEFPILDGKYEILTTCEDKAICDSITLSSTGLIQTGVVLGQYYGKYSEPITINASVTNLGQFNINDGKISFYIDKFYIGEADVVDNKASITFIPSDNKTITTGIHNLEARFSGTPKFSSSRIQSSILLSRNTTTLELVADNVAIYDKPYKIQTYAYYIDEEGNKNKIKEGSVTYYLHSTKIGTVEVTNGLAEINFNNFTYEPNRYQLTAAYEGTDLYAHAEISKKIDIIGGDTHTTVFNIDAKPTDTITFKAKVTNINNQPLKVGHVIFSLQRNDNTEVIGSAIIDRGVATLDYTINSTVLNNEPIVEYDIIAEYIDDDNLYQNSTGIGLLHIEQGKVKIYTQNIFFGSQHEPLGFYVLVLDAKNNQPVDDGTITIDIPDANGIKTSAINVDKDGGARIIYQPINFMADEFKQLLDFSFQIDINGNLWRLYDGALESDLQLMDFDTQYSDSTLSPEDHLFYRIKNESSHSDAEETLLFLGRDLYARTNIDTKRQYKEGTFDVFVKYDSEAKYQSNNANAIIQLQPSIINIDVHSDVVTYGDVNKSIICYINEYNLGVDVDTIPVNTGKVFFFIDNNFIIDSNIVNGSALLGIDALDDVHYGHHLLTAKYLDGDRTTYTYADLVIKPIASTLSGQFDKIRRGEKSKLQTTITIANKYKITGNINIYMDDELIANKSINSNKVVSKITSDFTILMPNDLDIEKHVLTIEYSGDDHIAPAKETIILKEKQLPITIDTNDVYVAQNERCHIVYYLEGSDGGIINEGEIGLFQGNNNLKAKGNVKNNIAIIDWKVTDSPSDNPYLYTVKYLNGDKYTNSTEPIRQNVFVVEAQDDVYIAQDEYTYEIPQEYKLPIFKTLTEALQCVKTNGNIHIVDYVNVDENIIINKKINIIGANNAKINKDLPNLLAEDTSTLKIYDFEDFNKEIYEIVGLQLKHLNIVNFNIFETELFFVQDNNIIPIFLLTDGKFYSYDKISLSTILNNVNITFNDEVNIKNIHFTSNDITNTNDLIIKVYDIAHFYKTIIDSTVMINNQKELSINNSLVYGHIIGLDTYNLDNNWWGSNNKPQYNINDQLQLNIWTNDEPPIIGDDITIHIGLKNKSDNYIDVDARDVPPLSYVFESETGLFSSQHGKMINGEAKTIYMDGTEECSVYCTVDNEKVSLDILDYERKTEILLAPNIDIPINYQVSLKAKVQSAANTYYKVDKNGLIQSGNTINDGYVDFYIDDKKIGHARVINGLATLPVFFSSQQYPITENIVQQHTIILKTIYRPNDYYFECQNEQEINLINGNRVCYVSPESNENGIGTFNDPFDSIAKAVAKNMDRIYLKNGTYQDNKIEMSYTQDIRAYDGECIFENNNNTIFICENNAALYLTGLTFKNNHKYIVYEPSSLTINECVFDNNSNILIKNITNSDIIIQDSVILHNEKILKNKENSTYNINYCWFGANTPNIQETFNNHIVMNFTSSKTPICLGSVVRLIASINYYEYNGEKYVSDHKIPMRIAKFYSDYGSLMPMYDHTYNNKAISFLNTNEESISDWIIAWPFDNTNYINKPITLKCSVKDFYETPINNGYVRFNVIDNKNNIMTTEGNIQNGVATGHFNVSMPEGEYTLFLYYINDNQEVYTTQSSFKVTKPILKVENFNLEQGDYIYNMNFELDITDVFGNEAINQNVDIYIDDQYIKQSQIINNKLKENLVYKTLSLGQHILKITTKNTNSIYDDFTFTYKFIATKKETYILFDYTGLNENEPTDLIIKVYDKEGRLVQDGIIEVKYDNEKVYVDNQSQYSIEDTNYDYITLQNGIGIIYDFYSDEGQHSIAIHYKGDNTIYNDCLYIDNNFNVNLDEVIIESQELLDQLSVDIGQTLKLNFPIIDTHKKMVKYGYVNIYIDNNATPLNEEPLEVKNGYVYFEGTLPFETKAIAHDIAINYIDSSNRYLPTTYYNTINVKPIKTQILIDTIRTTPNQTVVVPYRVESKYGIVQTGNIKVYYNDELLNNIDVSDGNAQIPLNIPMFSANKTYDLTFKYTDSVQNTYEDTEQIVKLLINRAPVNITPQINKYYPKMNFNYIINITDDNGNNINFGNVTLYIDNVKVKTKQIQNGQVSIPLYLDTVKDYNFNIIYEENEYYSYTSEECIFTISNMDISDIYVENTNSIPNQNIDTILHFVTPNNVDVSDGFVDLYLDDNKINTYAIGESTKYIQLNIPNLDAKIYNMKIKYYDSSFFKDNTFIHNFTITKQNINMSVPTTYVAELNDTISFTTEIEENIEGMLEYYLISIKNDEHNAIVNSRFIGISAINNKNNIDFEYKLPNNLEQDDDIKYQICVKFLGNNQYYEQTKSFALTINKTKPRFTKFSITKEVEYQSRMTILAKINVISPTLIYFYLDNDILIATKRSDKVNEDGYVEIDYALNDTYIPGTEHTITAIVKESLVLEETSINDTFNIIKTTPILSETISEAYVGQKLILPTEVIDYKGNNVTTGTLTYKIDNTTIATCTPGTHKEYQLNTTYQSEISIKVSYKAGTNSYYNNFNETMVINLQKNNIYFSLNTLDPVTRGVETNREITMYSPTIKNIGDIEYTMFLDDIQIESLSPLVVPLTFPDKSSYILKIKYNGNDIFASQEQTFTLINQNAEKIILSDIKVDGKNDLELAFDLIAENGMISVDKDTSNANIINNKNVTLRGNGYKLANCTIENNAKLTLFGCLFDGSSDSIIKNNNELYARECTFKNGNAQQYGGAIYISNKNVNTEITECNFTNNKASIYGGAIFSNKGNDVTIQSSKFYTGNRANSKGSSISSNGNINILQNMFYGNIGTYDIYLISGTSTMQDNYFDGSIKAIENKGEVLCNLNYWGYNDINNIQNLINGINFDTWLISSCEIIDYEELRQGEISTIFKALINQYRNKIDNTDTMYKTVISDVPITVNNETSENYKLNNKIKRADENIEIVVGKQHLIVGEENATTN